MTDFRARGTIMGPTGLTAVFGMGTGVAPPVWSPEIRPAGGQAGPGEATTQSRCSVRSRRTALDRSSRARGQGADKRQSLRFGRAYSNASLTSVDPPRRSLARVFVTAFR